MGSNIQLQASHGVIGGVQPLSATYLVVGSNLQTINTVLSSGTNTLVAASWLAPGSSAGDLQLIYILANQPCTLYTNNPSGSSPTNTISITAGIPIYWDTNVDYTCQFSGNVTAWYITNTTALNLRALILTF